MNPKTLEIILKAKDLASKVIGDVADKTDKLSNSARSAASGGLKTMGAGLSGLATASMIAIPVVTGLLGGIGAISIKSAADMETMKSSLLTAMDGSQQAADEAYKTISTFATKTPYELGEVMNSFVKLKNMGLNPSMEALTSYGDTASAMGKGLNDMVEAVADAATGEFERLKEFGIRASSQGNRVKFTFKGVTTEVGKNSKEIEDYLIKLGKTNFAGGMERQSQTFNGMMSTLKDTFSQTMAAFANDTGLLEWAKKGVGAATRVLDAVNPIYKLLSSDISRADFAKAMGIEEGSALIDNIFNIRGAVLDLWDIISTGELISGDGLLAVFGRDKAEIIATFVETARAKLFELSDWFTSTALPAIQTFLDTAWANLQLALAYFGEVLWPTVLKPALDNLYEAWITLQPALMELWGIFQDYIIPILGFVAGVAIVGLMVAFNIASEAIKAFAPTVVGVVQMVRDRLDNLKNFVVAVMNGDWKGALTAGAAFFKSMFLDPIMLGINLLKNGFSGLQNMANNVKNSGNAARTFIEGRAAGGPVKAGQVYAVGENPDGSFNKTTELFIPNQSGKIMNARDTQKMMAGSGGGGGGSNNVVFNINVQTSSLDDDRSITDWVRRAKSILNRELNLN